MNDEPTIQDALRLDPCFVPSLDAVARAWFEARHRFQIERCRQNQNHYERATNELWQTFSRWSAEEPEFFEQVRMWIDSHPED